MCAVTGSLIGPVSLSILTVAESGERKTAADRAMRAGADRWQKEKRQQLAPKITEQAAIQKAFEAEQAGLATAMRQASAQENGDKRAADVAACQRAIIEQAAKGPSAAPSPTLFHENTTIEGLAKSLRQEWPSSSWWSNEGGSVVGGHGLSDKSAMRTLATLNALWDGQPLDRSRSTEARTIVHGRRLTVSLMMQPVVFARLVAGKNGIARGLGALARFLVSRPESTAGTRLYRPAPDDPAHLRRFHERITALLDHRLPMPFDLEAFRVADDEEASDPLELRPAELWLSSEAFEVWRQLHDDVERELADAGDYACVRDVAAKTADNAARIAAIFHVLAHGPGGVIGAEHMANAAVLAVWYLYEARRILVGAGDSELVRDAKVFVEWLEKQPEPPTLKVISQGAPYRLRKKCRRDGAIAFLQAKGWLRLEQRSGQTVAVLNPAVRGGS